MTKHYLPSPLLPKPSRRPVTFSFESKHLLIPHQPEGLAGDSLCNNVDPCASPVNYDAALVGTYVCGDSRLGPTDISAVTAPYATIEDLFDSYTRLGSYCASSYIKEFWDATTSSWIYPPNNGFAVDTNGNPIMATVTLPAGTWLDRFGSDYGSFLSPYASPYDQRALPVGSFTLLCPWHFSWRPCPLPWSQ